MFEPTSIEIFSDARSDIRGYIEGSQYCKEPHSTRQTIYYRTLLYSTHSHEFHLALNGNSFEKIHCCRLDSEFGYALSRIAESFLTIGKADSSESCLT